MENLNINDELEKNIYIYGLYCGSGKNKNIDLKLITIEKDIINTVCVLVPDILEFNSELIIEKNLNIQILRNIFLRGYFDSTSKEFDEDCNECLINMDKQYYKYIPTPFIISLVQEENIGFSKIIIKGCNIIEFLDALYKTASYFNINNKLIYDNILNKNLGNSTKNLIFYKMNNNAFSPTKNRITDSGYDLYIIEKISKKNNLYLYDTGIIVQPPYGIYFDLVPRSSIIKKGYMLANSVGIIDQTFRGTIKVALIKIDPDADELELPQKIVQLIPRQVIQMEVCEIKNKNELISTVREMGEFGSTDKIKN